MFFWITSTVVYGQVEKSHAAEKRVIDSLVNVNNNKLHIVLSCGPTISKRSAYSSYDSDTLVCASGFLYDSASKLDYHWRFDYVDTKLVKATVSIGVLPNPDLYKAVYYFRGQELILVEGEDSKYSNRDNVLRSAEGKLRQPLND
jgi:hypothetical protein